MFCEIVVAHEEGLQAVIDAQRDVGMGGQRQPGLFLGVAEIDDASVPDDRQRLRIDAEIAAHGVELDHDILGILASEECDLALPAFAAAEPVATGDPDGHQDRDQRLAMAGAAGQRIGGAAQQQAGNQVVGRLHQCQEGG